MSTLITCPSGLVLSIRGMKAKEMVHLQDKKTLKSGLIVDKILGACIEAVQDPGPYPEMSSADLDAMLLGDKFFALLNVRTLTFGSSLDLAAKCVARSCGKEYNLSIKLDELPIKTLAPADATTFKAGKPMTCKSPSDGKLITYRLTTGKDERAATKTVDDENPVLAILALRIESIEGVETMEEFGARMAHRLTSAEAANRVQKFGGVRGYLDELPMADVFALSAEMEKHECGVETSIEAECPTCGHVQKETLHLGPNFWRPTKA